MSTLRADAPVYNPPAYLLRTHPPRPQGDVLREMAEVAYRGYRIPTEDELILMSRVALANPRGRRSTRKRRRRRNVKKSHKKRHKRKGSRHRRKDSRRRKRRRR